MGKIIQLDDILSNKIAAGEVVERPASVVKELVENAIDAHSTVVEIDIEEAGLSKICIIDNGDGIEEEDCLKAFNRHATSKIKNEEDLFRIRTLGFRGEALPSIASVSQLELISSVGDQVGTRIYLEGGKLVKQEQASARKGTEITVSNLFYNTPARLKYMKTVHTELGNITDVVNRLALAHPEVSIRLRHHDRVLLQTNGKGDVRQVLASIYGVNIAKMMIPLSGTSLDFEIDGWISLPEVTRASRNYISTMINGRFIKNYPLAKAIQEGYHTLLPIGRYPIVLLNIKMDPLLVDVNVHPSKMEVRFSKEKELNELVTTCIKKVFQKEELIPKETMKPKSEVFSEQQIFSLDHLPVKESHSNRPSRIGTSNSYEKPSSSLPKEEMKILYEREVNDWNQEQQQVQNHTAMMDDLPFPEVTIHEPTQPFMEEQENTNDLNESKTESRIPPMYPIGQMHGTYIFAQNERGLYIIDQHAAQERLKYEFFREKVGQIENELQDMLIPLTLQYSMDEFVKITEYQEELEKVGVFLESFGPSSFIVRSHPQWFPKGEEKEIIEEMIEQLLTMKTVDIKKLREEAAIMMSCKASIKANRHLRDDEIQSLLDSLRMSSDPFTCPHGRPIIIHYSTYEMQKMFKRVM
ncbi:DNA mismatch repair protein MutL [Oikeobacillus pervagus]|uniref:DNA mismatch repair protein MutL n=1 Tax=Oikeobacillus pervagus TaxID=1325931 RepID=A0AAJ1WG63_9BACI|nr:DNA mismatch repair endonuclease MutL [Oikeobacillus pervagus]MDQ0214697.1 DNA mismatch repair protein MutL [Oikeobacillus pervagus]